MAKTPTGGIITSFDKLNDILNVIAPDGEMMDINPIAKIDEWIPTGWYILNAAFSGSIFGGLPNRRSVAFAGEESTGKTYLAMSIVRNAQKMGYTPIYCDSEGSIDIDFATKLGVDPSKVRLQLVNTIEEMNHIMAQIVSSFEETLAKKKTPPKIMIVLDSLGNLTSAKERDDSITGSDKRDMTKQQQIRKMFRVNGVKFAKLGIPFIVTAHTYACIFSDVRVQMENDTLKNINDIHIGEYVKTLNGPKEVLNTFKYEINNYIELKFEDGYKIKCTNNHKFGIERNNEIIWITGDELNENDEIILIEKGKFEQKHIKKLKLISKKYQNNKLNVYDIEIKDVNHYFLENNILSHNSMSMFSSKEISGGGGLKYNASIIFQLGKGNIDSKEEEYKEGKKELKKRGLDEKTKVGITVYVKPYKSRFARPILIKILIPFYKKPNPYVGLHEFLNWKDFGVIRGKIVSPDDYEKLSDSDKKKCYDNFDMEIERKEGRGQKAVFTKEKVKGYVLPSDTAKTLVVKHLGGEVPIQELFTSKIFTDKLLHELDEKVIKPTFSLPDINSLEDLAEIEKELFDEEELNENEED